MTTNGQLEKELVSFYNADSLQLKSVVLSKEKNEYCNATFMFNEKLIVYRKAKITPKKVGQFVAVWKRCEKNKTKPFDCDDTFDFFIIQVEGQRDQKGQFIFPKSVLLEKDIVSRGNLGGKRGFRVYPPWDITLNKKANKAQKWQLKYFYTEQLVHEKDNSWNNIFR